MALNTRSFGACLDELDRCLFDAAAHPDCGKFHNDTQLTAVLILLVRCSSLLRSLVQLFESGATDAFQVTLRAFEESWYLAFYFRAADSAGDSARWLAEKGGSWSPPIGDLVAFAKERGVAEPAMGRDYGRLSEVAHPTKAAAYNSVTLCGDRLGMGEAKKEMAEEVQNEEARFADALYRLTWVILDGDKKFIALGIGERDLPLCAKFIELDKHRESDDKNGHTIQTPLA